MKRGDKNGGGWGIMLFLILVAFLYWLAERFGAGRRTRKADLAGKYHLKGAESLMDWIRIFCPAEIAAKYVGSKRHYIKESDLHPYLGSPDDYPVDDAGRLVTGKRELAAALHMTPKTFSRRMSEIKGFEGVVGMSETQYKRMKRLPPKHVNSIISHFQTSSQASSEPK